jgi:pantothenate kinase
MEKRKKSTKLCRLLRFPIEESGFTSLITYTKSTVETQILPLIEKISEEFLHTKGHLYVIGVAGPPGSGKSSFSCVFRQLLTERGLNAILLPLDGFHLKNEQLKKTFITVNGRNQSLLDLKGAKETYDVEKLLQYMEKLYSGKSFYWPVYLRTIHEPVEEGIFVTPEGSIYIVEGNYLFLDLPLWKDLIHFFHTRLFLLPKRKYLKRRIMRRKCRGGYTRIEALHHFRRSDLRNINEVLSQSTGYDFLIRQKSKHSYLVEEAFPPASIKGNQDRPLT